jgi:hypothetical protein
VFQLVGARWRNGTLDAGTTSVEFQVHRASGWTPWTALSAEDGGADGGSADALRSARVRGTLQTAEPVWVGDADGVRARVVGRTDAPAALPSDLTMLLVDGGTSSADADPRPATTFGGAVAVASASRPTIYTRSDWGADESLRRSACPAGPDYSPTIKMGFIHHTDTGNGYSRAAVPGIIRGIYAYHVQGNGWCDVGYNYLVDRFGRIWEGRYGGITRAVIGAHTGGFNYDSFGTSLIGTYDSAQPSAAMLSAVEKLFAWRLGGYYRDPTRTSVLTAASFSGSRHRAGTDVRFSTVSGHRDADYTTCPGHAAYADLPAIRSGIRSVMGAGFVRPAAAPSTVKMASGAVDLGANVLGKQTWQLTVATAGGQVVRTMSGTATRSTPVAADWDLADDAEVPVPPGVYTLHLTGHRADGVVARSWQTTVTVTPPLSLRAPAQTSLNSPVVARGTGIPGHKVAVSVSGPAGAQPVGTFTVSSAGKWTGASAPVDATRDLTWTAADTQVPTYQRNRTTRVGPTLSAPVGPTVSVDAGSPVTVQGTALAAPAATVRLVTQAKAATTPTTGPVLPVASDGTWSTAFTPTTPTSFWAVDGRGLQSAHAVAYPLSSPTAAAPTDGYAGRHVFVRGNAGGPVPVTLSARPPGGSWATVRTVTAGSDGKYAARLPIADAPGDAVKWRISTGHGTPATGSVTIQPVFAPTVAGPTRSGWRKPHYLRGSAVPGDVVTIWTAPAGSTRFVARGAVRAAADASWTFRFVFRHDTVWRVTSPSGTSATGSTVVVPSIHAPGSVASRHLAVVHGRAIPGEHVTLYRRLAGATVWKVMTRMTVPAGGRWTVSLHPRHTAAYRATSHRQTSRVVSVVVE